MSVLIELFLGSRSDLIDLFTCADDSLSEIGRYIDAGEVLVARIGERIVGYVQSIVIGSYREIKSIAVAESEQRSGIGTSLIRTALNAAWSAGVERVFISTATADFENLRFYQRLGFRMHSVERDVFTVERGYSEKGIDGVLLLDRVWLSIDAPASATVRYFQPVLHEDVPKPICEPHMLIRAATPDDARSIAAVYLESAQHHAQLDPERYLIPSVDNVSARYRPGGTHCSKCRAAITLVADISTEIVGFVDAFLEPPLDAMLKGTIYCNVSEIAVCARHRNRGVGKELLRAIEDWARKQGAEFSVLEYHVANTNARGFYVSCIGYSETSITALKRL